MCTERKICLLVFSTAFVRDIVRSGKYSTSCVEMARRGAFKSSCKVVVKIVRLSEK